MGGHTWEFSELTLRDAMQAIWREDKRLEHNKYNLTFEGCTVQKTELGYKGTVRWSK